MLGTEDLATQNRRVIRTGSRAANAGCPRCRDSLQVYATATGGAARWGNLRWRLQSWYTAADRTSVLRVYLLGFNMLAEFERAAPRFLSGQSQSDRSCPPKVASGFVVALRFDRRHTSLRGRYAGRLGLDRSVKCALQLFAEVVDTIGIND
jgi:hypothetical protein